MQKITAIIVAVAMLSGVFAIQFSSATTAPQMTVVFGTPEAIDGSSDGGWSGVESIALDQVLWSPGEGFSASAKVMYDSTYLYFLVDVTDPTVGTLEQETVGAADYWQRDTVQIYLDLGNEKTTGARDENDIRFDVNVRGAFFPHMIRATAFIDHAVEITETGYTVECAVDPLPMTTVAISPL